MTTINVQHYRCFTADKRTSMDVFADSLYVALNSQATRTRVNNTTHLKLSKFKPQSRLEKYSSNRFLMRYLRYWQYPNSIKNVPVGVGDEFAIDIHHVLDHGYAHLLPKLVGGKTCICVHDLIPLLQWKGLIGGSSVRKPWLNLKSLSYLSDYNQLVAISQNTKQDMIQHLHLPAEKIEVISPVIADHFKPVSENECSNFGKRYGLSKDCLWLMISGREFYKNHAASLKVFKQLVNETGLDIRLIKTGLPSIEFDQEVRRLGLEEKVTQLFLNDFSELPLLYNFVDCLLFPSLYEGFGMPVAEALACGTPVVSSDRASLIEVGGDLVTRNDPGDIDGLTQSILSVLQDKTIGEALKRSGPQWCSQFRAPAVADHYQKLYSSMLS